MPLTVFHPRAGGKLFFTPLDRQQLRKSMFQKLTH
jgi:hypothetical protein